MVKSHLEMPAFSGQSLTLFSAQWHAGSLGVLDYVTLPVAFSCHFFICKMGTLDFSLATHRSEIATLIEMTPTGILLYSTS